MNYYSTPQREPDEHQPAEGSTAHEARCFELLHIVMDGEATPEEVDFFNRHAHHCMSVYQMYQLDSTIKKVLCHKLEKKSVPLGLIDSIRSKIKELAV